MNHMLVSLAHYRLQRWLRIYDRLIGSDVGLGRSIAIHARAAGIVWHDRALNLPDDRRFYG